MAHSKEYSLHRVWRSGSVLHRPVVSACGRELVVLDQGTPNRDAGPDFTCARVRYNGLVWIGDIEIHARSSDWYRHGHHLDPAYNAVLVHVVSRDDARVFDTRGRRIPALLLAPATGAVFTAKQDCPLLTGEQTGIRPASLRRWLTRLEEERFSQAAARIIQQYEIRPEGWEETLVRVLGSSFGLPLNRLPLEWTLTSIPYRVLHELRNHREGLEAILFGQAGMLASGRASGPYAANLRREYHRWKRRLHASPVRLHMWKYLRLRPVSFPERRISQLAGLLAGRLPLLGAVLDTGNLSELALLLKADASAYWETRYRFGSLSPASAATLGDAAVTGIILNGVVPFLAAYGIHRHRPGYIDRACRFLHELPPESNFITRNWRNLGVFPANAFESQALIQLYKNYCSKRECSRCCSGSGSVNK